MLHEFYAETYTGYGQSPVLTTVLGDTDDLLLGVFPHSGTLQPDMVPVTVRVRVKGTRRVIEVHTDASGNFEAYFVPLASEAGHCRVGADHPGLAEYPVQAPSLISMPCALGHRTCPCASSPNCL